MLGNDTLQLCFQECCDGLALLCFASIAKFQVDNGCDVTFILSDHKGRAVRVDGLKGQRR